ncbi:MAG: DUF2855 family protein [Angustibacter sp.]
MSRADQSRSLWRGWSVCPRVLDAARGAGKASGAIVDLVEEDRSTTAGGLRVRSVVHVNRADLTDVAVTRSAHPVLADGAVRLRVDSFAITANTVIYAASGERLGYWGFFPAPVTGRGVVPAWGYASVEESRHADFTVGERIYGFVPMSTHLDVRPGSVTPGWFTDTAAHRQVTDGPMNPMYHHYQRLAGDPWHDPDREAHRMVAGPLFLVAFLLEESLRRHDWYDAQALLTTSASSRTALALASIARAESPQIRRIGLTSPGRLEPVRATGLYDTVCGYHEVGSLPLSRTVVVDLAGDLTWLRPVHQRLGDSVAASFRFVTSRAPDGPSAGVQADGDGSGDAGSGDAGSGDAGSGDGGASDLAGPEPVLFYPPEHLEVVIRELGLDGFAAATAPGWSRYLRELDGFLQVAEQVGLTAAAAAFGEAVSGRAGPSAGVVIRP